MTPEGTIIVQLNTGTPALTEDLRRFLDKIGVAQQYAHVLVSLYQCSEATGGYVQFKPEYEYVPVLIGSDGEAIPLYHVVEVLDEVLEYNQVRRELPTLSFSQINGAISFLRKIAQYNPRNIDFDLLEDQEMSSDPAFLSELRLALADKETSRVLHRD